MDANMVTILQPTSQYAEAFRVLRTNLSFSSVDKDRKVILLTSAKPGEGKTTTISNLAVTLAKYQLKTILIDADLRRPHVHEMFGLDQRNGLTHFLLEKKDYKNYITEIEDVPNLHVMTAGIEPPEPSELIDSNKMRQFIENVKNDYDMVLIDTPPILAASDTSILARMSDGIILVIAANKSKVGDLRYAKEQIERIETKFIGSVLTMVNNSSLEDKYYY